MRALLALSLLPFLCGVWVSGSPVPQNDGEISPQLSEEPKPNIYYLHVQSNIRYRYAKTKVMSRVANPANVSQEVKFEMVLPKTAFITGFIIQVKGKNYESQILEKDNAQKVYQEAVDAGLTAGQVNVKARDSNEFFVSLSIEARGKVGFELTYEELLTRTLGTYNYVVNLNPRQFVQDLLVNVSIYEPSGIRNVMVPELKTSNELSESPEVENKLVKIEKVSKNQMQILYQPTPEQQREETDQDFKGQLIVRYDVERTPEGGEVLVNEGYFVHFFSPDNLPVLPKFLVFVLDVSGSMSGRKMVQLKEAMKKIFDEMRNVDYFSILEFSYITTVRDLDNSSGNINFLPEGSPPLDEKMEDFSKVYPATEDNIVKAKKLIDEMTAGGGTNIYSALQSGFIVGQKGLEVIKKGGSEGSQRNIEPIVIFLTDGEATVGNTNYAQILSMVSELNITPRILLYSLAFGYEPDIQFLRKLSLANGGFARSIYTDADAALQLTSFYKEVSSPLLSNVTFSYVPGQVDNTSLTSYNFPILFKGSELIVAGVAVQNKVEASVKGMTLSAAQVFNAPESRDVPDDITQILYVEGDEAYAINKKIEQNRTYGTLERLWAYLTINNLLDKKEVSMNATETSELTAKAMDLALKYKFVTPLTSLVVVKPNETNSVISSKDQDSSKGMGGYADRAGLIYSGQLPPSSAGFIAPGTYTQYQLSMMAPGSFGGGGAHDFTASSMSMPRHFTTALSRAPTFDIHQTMTNPHTMSVDKIDTGSLFYIDWAENDETVILPNSTVPLKILHDPPGDSFGSCEIKTEPTREGTCIHFQRCILLDAIATKDAFLPYFCPIDGGYLGMCCPSEAIGTTTFEPLPTLP